MSVQYLKASIKFKHSVGKLHTFSFPEEGSDSRVVFQPEVISDKIPVQTEPPPLLLLEQDVRRWTDTKV